MAKHHVLKKSTMNPDTTVYRAVKCRPDENLSKAIDLMGGIESVVGADDVVVIKPNVQWWNQGVPNLSALNTFVELIMHRPGGFNGEVVIAENVHRGASPWESIHSGWAPGPKPGMIGAEIGVFMNTIRKADLNITTAEWVGMASRTDPPVAHTRAVLASTGPVALDYHSTKYLLYPNSKISLHNPDDPKSSLNQYLVKCSEKNGGVFDEKHVAVKSFDFGKGRLQDDSELTVVGEKEWGRNPKIILKYFVLRYGSLLL